MVSLVLNLLINYEVSKRPESRNWQTVEKGVIYKDEELKRGCLNSGQTVSKWSVSL